MFLLTCTVALGVQARATKILSFKIIFVPKTAKKATQVLINRQINNVAIP